jgi:hypothetical protein
VHCAVLGRLLMAGPEHRLVAVSSPKQLAVWAAAADAGLRLLPALLAQQGKEASEALLILLFGRLWLPSSARMG